MVSISELTPVANQLKAKSESINKTIAALNAQLADLNLGIEVWLESYPVRVSPYYSDNEREGIKFRIAHLVGYAKVEDQWQLAVREVRWEGNPDDSSSEEEDVDPEDIPLVKASRTIRLESTACLPYLLDKIKERAERLVDMADKAEEAASKAK